MKKRGFGYRIARFIVMTLIFLAIQFVISGGISWYFDGSIFQGLSKFMPYVGIVTCCLGIGYFFIFFSDLGTSDKELIESGSRAGLDNSFVRKIAFDSQSDIGSNIRGIPMIVSGAAVFAISHFLIH